MHRGSHRYVLVRFLGHATFSAQVIEQSVRGSIEGMLGKFGSAEARTRMISFDEAGSKAVFRCDSGSVEKVRAVLALMTHVDGTPAAAMVLRSSGTIKALGARIQRRPK